MRRRRRARGVGHVVIVVQNMPVPLDRRVWQECLALRDVGHHVSVISPRGEGQARVQVLDGVAIHTYPPPPPTGGPLSYLVEFAYCWLATFLVAGGLQLRRGIDVLQTCNPPDTYWLLARLHRPFGTRFVYDQHDLCPEVYESRFGTDSGPLLRVLRALEKATYRTADHVVVTNDSYREVALRRGELAGQDVTVVRSGPDPRRMRRREPRPELREGRRHLCCWLGIMGPQDGVDLLLDAIASLVHDHGRHDCHFALLGYGDCLEDLRAKSHALGLDPWVTFTGRVGPDEIAAYLSTADIGLSADPRSPLNDVSTMNKTLEYMAYELPVVAYDLKETRVSAGPAAVYVTPNETDAYAKAVAELLDDPVERRRMGALGRSRIEDQLSWQRQVPGYLQVFDRLEGLTAPSPTVPPHPVALVREVS
jgi:glycosyltransferase involved in cell wall biosynthesis